MSLQFTDLCWSQIVFCSDCGSLTWKKVASECAFNCLNALLARFRCCELSPLCKQWHVNISLDIKRDIACIILWQCSVVCVAYVCLCRGGCFRGCSRFSISDIKSQKARKRKRIQHCLPAFTPLSIFFSKPICHLTESKSPLSNKSSLIGSSIADV